MYFPQLFPPALAQQPRAPVVRRFIPMNPFVQTTGSLSQMRQPRTHIVQSTPRSSAVSRAPDTTPAIASTGRTMTGIREVAAPHHEPLAAPRASPRLASPVATTSRARVVPAATTASASGNVADPTTSSIIRLHAPRGTAAAVSSSSPISSLREGESSLRHDPTAIQGPACLQESAINTSDTAPLRRPLSGYERAIIQEACVRWQPASIVTPNVEKQFFRDIVSAKLAPKLAGHHNLLLLTAGLAYVKDNARYTTATRHRSQVLRLSYYLRLHDDPDLLSDCDDAATHGVARCGDRLSYGLTQVEQVIELHRIHQNDLTPSKLFKSIQRIFLHQRVEAHAVELTWNHHESVECYVSLSQELRAGGFDLLDTSDSSIYGRLYHVDNEQADRVAEALRQDLNHPSDAYVDMFIGNVAVQQILRTLFSESFSQMEDERDEFMDQANEAMFDADASTDRTCAGEETLHELANLDKDWYREKTVVVLRNVEMLG